MSERSSMDESHTGLQTGETHPPGDSVQEAEWTLVMPPPGDGWSTQSEIERVHEMAEALRRDRYRDYYLPLIEQGEWSVLALTLSRDGDAVSEVVSQMLKQQNMDVNVQLQALKVFLELDALEGQQLGESAKETLRRLATGWQNASAERSSPQSTPESGQTGPANDAESSKSDP